LRAFLQARPENAMLQIGERFFTAGDCEFNRYRTSYQAPNLRKDKPHPVNNFFSGLKFLKNFPVDWLLCLDKTLEMESIGGLFRAIGTHRTGAVATELFKS